MDAKQLRQRRILEFMGWLLLSLALIFGAVYWAWGSQPEKEIANNDDLIIFQKSANERVKLAQNYLDTIDILINDYIDGKINTPTDLTFKVEQYRKKISNSTQYFSNSPERDSLKDIDRFAYINLSSMFSRALVDKKNKIDYLTGNAPCTEALKAKCCIDSDPLMPCDCDNQVENVKEKEERKCKNKLRSLARTVESSINSIENHNNKIIPKLTVPNKKGKEDNKVSDSERLAIKTAVGEIERLVGVIRRDVAPHN